MMMQMAAPINEKKAIISFPLVDVLGFSVLLQQPPSPLSNYSHACVLPGLSSGHPSLGVLSTTGSAPELHVKDPNSEEVSKQYIAFQLHRCYAENPDEPRPRYFRGHFENHSKACVVSKRKRHFQ